MVENSVRVFGLYLDIHQRTIMMDVLTHSDPAFKLVMLNYSEYGFVNLVLYAGQSDLHIFSFR